MIGVMLLNLRRVFELVDRNILLKKMKWYGMKGIVLSWFRLLGKLIAKSKI